MKEQIDFKYRGYNFTLHKSYYEQWPGFVAHIRRYRGRFTLNFTLPFTVCGTEDQLKLWLLLAVRAADRKLPAPKARLCDRCKGQI